MNTSTYAKLTKPPQFRADESVTFRLEFSNDLACTYGTLKIYGYSFNVLDGKRYEGIKITQYINTFVLGVGYEEYIIPPNTLAEVPDWGTKFMYPSGVMKAVVEIGTQLDEEGNAIPMFKSNEIIVDMPVNFREDYYIEPATGILNATSSIYQLPLVYIDRKLFGSFGSTEVNSYRVLLYDSNYNLVKDSGAMYDWNNGLYWKHYYTLTDLNNDTTYYVKAKYTLGGGYVIDLDFRQIDVKYSDVPVHSDNLLLDNDKVHGRVNVNIVPDVQYNKIVISREIKDTGNYLEIKAVNKGNLSTDRVKIYDYYALPNTTYMYRAVLFNGEDIVATYYNAITHEFDGVCIADASGAYNALAFEKKYPINKNDRASVVEPMDTKYPTVIRNSSLDSDSGSITATYAHIDKCEPDFANNAGYSQTIRHWLNNGKTKLLKFYNGECWLVSVSGVTDDEPNGNDVIVTSFNWTEVGNAKDNSEYKRLGLIINE